MQSIAIIKAQNLHSPNNVYTITFFHFELKKEIRNTFGAITKIVSAYHEY